MRILLLTPQFPYPPHQGTTIRNYNLIFHLAKRHDVHLLSFGEPSPDAATPLHAVCRTVQVIPVPHRSMGQRLRGLLLSSLPDMALRLPSKQFSDDLGRTMAQVDPDVIEVEGIELAQYLLQAARRSRPAGQTPGQQARRRPLLVFDDHNAEYVLQQRAFETEARHLLSPDRGWSRRWIGAVYSFVQWRRLIGYERRACRTADRVVAVSEADAQALRRLGPDLDPVVVPNGVDLEFYHPPDDLAAASLPIAEGIPALPAPGLDLIFTGKMDFRPNIDAVLWFAQEVLPRIRAEVPGVRFWVVGKDPHPRLDPLKTDPAVILTGRVEDVRPFIAAAAVYVIPLRIGGGTRLKVLEAMAMAKAIVSTTLGCEGFELLPGRQLVTADAPAEFAAAVIELLRDGGRRRDLGRAAHEFAARGYDWSMIVPRLEGVYRP